VAFAVVLDANVLVPAALRDTLLRAAESYLYRPIWSRESLVEVERTLTGAIGLSQDQAAVLLGAIGTAFPEAEVGGFDSLVGTMPVNPKDRRVVAAAVAAHALCIVTLDVDDFPRTPLDRFDIEVQSPDEFLQHLYELDSERMVEIIVEQAADLRDPPLTPRQVCEHLRMVAPGFVNLIGSRLPA
jgi:predicted nucleic acid-binding protein